MRAPGSYVRLLVILSHGIQSLSQPHNPDYSNTTFLVETDSVILDRLLEPSRYDNRQRPKNHTVITAEIQLFSVASPDESSLHYEIEFLLTLTWNDPRLVFNDDERHPYLKALHHADDLWIPDIYFINHGELKQGLVDMTLKVFSDGTVLHITKRSMIINCQGNLKIFPFDNPKCPFAFESVAHERPELELMWTMTQVPLRGATSFQFHNAYLVKNETGECDSRHTWRGNFSCLRVLLVFTRDKAFYFSTVFVPGMVLVSSSFISFWLDVNVVPARVMIGVTTMLNFCTTTNNFRSKLPVVSNLKAMNLWDGVCMFFIYASLLEFVIENFFERKYRKMRKLEVEGRALPSSTSKKKQRYAKNDDLFLQPIVKPSSSTEKDPVLTVTKDGQPLSEEEMEDISLPEEKKSSSVDLSPATTGNTSSRPVPAPTLIEYILVLKERSKSLDNLAKLIFPVIFALFTSCFFLTYAVIKPQHPENWELVGGD